MIPLGKLKRLLFIALLVVFGCEEQEKDCAGVAGGTSYEDECGGCDANVNNDCVQDCADVWGGNNICGCTDSTATNYNSIATYDDGSCEDCAGVSGGNNICGCTDSTATNYDPDATFDDGSCFFQCEPNYTYINDLPGSVTILAGGDSCFFNSDLIALNDIITSNQLSYETSLHLGTQTWLNGRLRFFVAGNYWGGVESPLSVLPESM